MNYAYYEYMTTLYKILSIYKEKPDEVKLVVEFIHHWAKKRNIDRITNQVAQTWIDKYAILFRKHYETALKKLIEHS